MLSLITPTSPASSATREPWRYDELKAAGTGRFRRSSKTLLAESNGCGTPRWCQWYRVPKADNPEFHRFIYTSTPSISIYSSIIYTGVLPPPPTGSLALVGTSTSLSGDRG